MAAVHKAEALRGQRHQHKHPWTGLLAPVASGLPLQAVLGEDCEQLTAFLLMCPMSGSGTFDSHHPKWYSWDFSHCAYQRRSLGEGKLRKEGRDLWRENVESLWKETQCERLWPQTTAFKRQASFGRTSLPVHWSFLQIGQAWKQEKQQGKVAGNDILPMKTFYFIWEQQKSLRASCLSVMYLHLWNTLHI